MMKRILIANALIILTSILYGQELKISIAPTINSGLYYQFVAGSPGQHIKAGLTTSLDYLFLSDNKINFGLGCNYHFAQVEFVPNKNTADMPLHSERVNIISLRLKSLLRFKNQWYFSLDPSVDFHLNYDAEQTLDKQSGIGLSCGLGKNIQIKEAIYLNIEPRLWVHNIFSFTEQDLPYRLTAVGLNLGLVFGSKSIDNK